MTGVQTCALPIYSDGNDDVVIFLKNSRSYKLLPPNRRVRADSTLRRKLEGLFGEENVKIRVNMDKSY